MSEDDLDGEIEATRRRLADLEQRRTAAASAVGRAQLGAGEKRSIAWVVGGLLLVGLIATCTMVGQDQPTTTSGAGTAVDAEPTIPVDPWNYRVETDAMSDGKMSMACIASTTVVRLEWPYKPQAPALCLRRSPKSGTDVIVRLLEGGQFVCRSYSGCSVKVRFDTGKVQTFTALESDDGSSDVLFISNSARFIEAFKAAETVLIEATFYKAGSQQMTFDAKSYNDAFLTK